jgi:hypothetical protein
MNNMKKQVLPILLALIMILVPSTVAFAAGGPGSLGSAEDITIVKIKTNTGTPEVWAEATPDSGGNATITVPYDFYQDSIKTQKPTFTPVIETADNVVTLAIETGARLSDIWSTEESDFEDIDFTTAVRFKTTDEDGQFTVFNVTVKPENPKKTNDMLSIKLTPKNGKSTDAVTVTPSSTNVNISMPFGTSLTDLTAAITHNGVKLTKSVYSGSAWGAFGDSITEPETDANFSNLVKYRVYAQDVDLKPTQYKEYTIAVSISPATITNDITKFVVGTAEGIIDQEEQTIDVKVANTFSLTSVTPIITHNGKTVTYSHNGTSDWTATSTPITFTANTPVTYRVVSQNGLEKDYIVTVTKEDPTRTNSILSLTINDVAGKITESVGRNTEANPATIEVILPFGTDLSTLVPVVKHNGADITKLITDNDKGVMAYTAPVPITVTAETAALKKFYKLTVTRVDPITAKAITSFKIGDVEGDIDGQNITVTLPFGSSRTALDPVIEHTGKSSSPEPATTPPLSFTNPRQYTVTAQDGSTLIYTVTVVITPPKTTKDITHFSIGNAVGTITGTDIAVTVPTGTDITKLIPAIGHDGVSVSPTGAQDFTNPVTYLVTAQDSSTKPYIVTVTVGNEPVGPNPPAEGGWVYEDGVWKYYDADGAAETNTWRYDKTYTAWYHFDKDGKMETSKWVYDDGAWYYVAANGKMVVNKWLQDDGKWYYLTGNGKMAIGTYTINGKTQSFAGNGVWKG